MRETNKNINLTIKGSCHCGSLSWEFLEPLEKVTACNCTLCRRYGALWAYGNLDHSIKISGETKGYSHGNKINGFHFCIKCGCLGYYLAIKPDTDGKYRIAVNMRMANDHEQIADLFIDNFDGFDTFDDLPRDHRKVRDLWF